ncbi:MAG TPA: helix-turn-helix transcriptional regulator [Solirubrobacteraceae bacterium]|jgi:AraC-like DNA-binding protein|nr:helix-turn-helix transcriptional regulator [Solirubrobacteraceae bacterium]
MSAVRHELPSEIRRALRADERIEWHFHDRAQLIYPGMGVLQVFTEGGSWIVPPLRGVWIPAGVAHAHRARGRTDLLSVGFAASVAPFGERGPVVVDVSPLLREVVLELTGGGDLSAATRRLLRQVALDQLQRVRILPLALPHPRDDRLVRIVEQLSSDPSDRRTLAQLGREVGAGERTLSRLFRSETGMSFPQWRGQLRLHQAQLLLAGGESVTGTAQACGYRSTSAFIEAFRAAFGSTPGGRQSRVASNRGDRQLT